MADNEAKFTFEESLEILGILEYQDRIMQSNSHGELFHILDYMHLANVVTEKPEIKEKVTKAIHGAVKHAEENWDRPESVFQHMVKILGG